MWPYQPVPSPTSPMRLGWEASLDSLDSELEAIDADDVVIGVVVDPAQIGISGQLRAGGRTAFRHKGVEVSFTTPKRGRLVFHTDAYGEVRQNVRAIAAGLEALRAVNRYGITSSDEQYAGFAQLTAGGPDAERGAQLVARAGGLPEALKKHHPDHGGNARDIADVLAYRERIGARA